MFVTHSSFSRRLTFLFCLVVLLSVSIPGYLLMRIFNHQTISDLQQSLNQQASLIAHQLDPEFFHEPQGSSARQIKKLSELSQCRVTLIRNDGLVLEDSHVEPAELTNLENHLLRPEMMEAFKGKPGHSIRFSRTLNADMLYAAVPFYLGDQITGVVRLSLSLKGIQQKLNSMQMRILFIGMGMILLAWILALFLSHSLGAPIADMLTVARNLTEGQFHSRVPHPGGDDLGQLGRAINFLADRVQKQIQELHYEKSHLSATLANMHEGVVVVSPDGKILTLNPAMEQSFNLNASEILNKPFIEALRHSQLNDLIEHVRAYRKPSRMEIRTFNPTERVYEAHGVPMFKEEDSIGTMLVLHDMTDVRRLEQIRRDFIANVSHELRTPLASIKGFAETLREGGLEDKANRKSFVASIEKHADSMTALVNDLLDLTLIESGRRVPQKQLFSFTKLVKEIIDNSRRLAEKRNVTLSNSIASELELKADRIQIQQVLTNLVENAIKFNKEGGQVTISAEFNLKHLICSVQDNGIGIPSQDVSRIFERFYRVDKARSREMGGTGLGLSIVKHIIESHNGTIEVHSQLGHGSVFTINLPLE